MFYIILWSSLFALQGGLACGARLRVPSAVPLRRNLDLQRDRLSAGYRLRLRKALSLLQSWVEGKGVPFLSLGADAFRTSQLLSDFSQFCYSTGRAYWVALYATLGVQTIWRQLRGNIRVAWDALQTWKLSRPVISRVPLRMEVITCLSHYALMASVWLDPGRAAVWATFAGILRLAFHGLMRPRELFDLKRGDIRLPSPGAFRNLQAGVIVIRDPKNRANAGRLQTRLLRDDLCLRWTSWLLAGTPSDAYVWPFSKDMLGKCLLGALTYFGIQDLGFTLSSFRAGGATALLESGVPVSTIKHSGGWSADKTLSSYLQEAEAALAMIRISDTSARQLER